LCGFPIIGNSPRGENPESFLHARGQFVTNHKVLESDNSKTARQTPQKGWPRCKTWLKRLGVATLLLVLLLVIFHRPLIFEGTRYFVVRAAKQQNLEINYNMSGSIFTTLSVRDLRAKPIEPGPIERLEIGEINLQYSLWDLIRDGFPAFLQLVELKDVFVEIAPGDPLPPEKEAERQAFKFPALLPKVFNLENVNLRVRVPTGDTIIEGLYFSLLPQDSGVLKVTTLDIPSVRRWTDIEAKTTFRDRNFMLTDLVIGDEIALRQFQLDMSQLEKSELGVALVGTFFDASLSLTAHVTDLNVTNELSVSMELNGLVLEQVWDYINLKVPVVGKLDSLRVDFAGTPETPADWKATIIGRASAFRFQDQPIGDISLDTNTSGGLAKIALLVEAKGANSLALRAEAGLPANWDNFMKATTRGSIELLVPETELLPLPKPIVGDVAVKIDFETNDGHLKSQAVLKSESLSIPDATLTDTHFTLHVEKDLTKMQKKDVPIFEGLATRLEGGIGIVKVQSYAADTLRIALGTRDAEVAVEEIAVGNGENSARVSASYVMPADMKSWDKQPLATELTVRVPDLSAFLEADSKGDLGGKLDVDGVLSSKGGAITGAFKVNGADIRLNGLPVRSANADVAIGENVVRIPQVAIVFDDANRITGSGDAVIGKNITYSGKLDVQLADLALFQPLFGATPDSPALAGSLSVLWSGSGDTGTPEHVGTANLSLVGASFGKHENLAASFNASYSPENINIPDWFVTSDYGTAAFSLFWKDNRLSVTNLAVRQHTLTLLEGEINVPLYLAEFKQIDRLIPPNEPLHVALRTRKLSVAALMRHLGEDKPPVAATIDLDATAHGTIESLSASADFKASGVQSRDADQFAPAEIAVRLDLKENRLAINGSVRQALIQPLQITGNLPLDVAGILARGNFDTSTPLDLRIRMPRSPLEFLSTIVPDIRRSPGTAEIDVRVGGTVASPSFGGKVIANISALRFADPSLPPINAMEMNIGFAGKRITINRFVGMLGGGSIAASGSVDLSDSKKPILNLQLGSNNALLLQNDDMTARVSSKVTLRGPLDTVNVSGNVWITRGRFFREIDILPIGLPGRPAPQPPSEPMLISFPKPPLRGWTFDVGIRTSDPFLVQSNLAEGRIFVDLRLAGNGLRPYLEGTVNIEKLTTSLPFSSLKIEDGQIFFRQEDPFVPQLSLRGTSAIRAYEVNVNITGSAFAPEAVFTSNPPLPQSEVVALIATGMTTAELSRDPNAIAGRAAILIFQRLYNRVFRRNRAPVQDESLLSRIQFDVGTVDPKTGKQATTIGIPLTRQITLVGGVDVGGNFRGQVKYLIRFR